MCPGGLAYQDGTPQNEQGQRPATNSVQSINLTSMPAPLGPHSTTFYYYSIYIVTCSVLTHPNLVHACLLSRITFRVAPPSSPPEVVPLLPTFCMYKVTLPCTLDHNTLKRALDWSETSEFLPLTSVHFISG